MPRTMPVCLGCHLPIHAVDAAALAVARCGCPGIRKIADEPRPGRQAHHPMARGLGLGMLAVAALASRHAEPSVSPARLDRALARSRPSDGRPAAYAELVTRDS